MRVVLLACVAVGSLLASCSGEQPCDPCRTSAIAYGSITVAGDFPRRPPVFVTGYRFVCGESWLGAGGVVLADTSGAYRMRMSSLFSPAAARCFRVKLNPERDPRWPTDSVDITGQVEFRFEDDESKMDSIRLDVVFPRGQ